MNSIDTNSGLFWKFENIFFGDEIKRGTPRLSVLDGFDPMELFGGQNYPLTPGIRGHRLSDQFWHPQLEALGGL